MNAFMPSELPGEELEKNFVGKERKKVLTKILQGLNIGNKGNPKKHRMIYGPKGIGKSHLLCLLYYKIKTETKLNERWFPILFEEEKMVKADLPRVQERIIERILKALEEEGNYNLIKEMKQKTKDYRENYPKHKRVELYFDFLFWFHKKIGKYILIITENLQQLFGEKLRYEEQEILRNFLDSNKYVTIIGSATTTFKIFHDPNQPFFGFFHKKERLKELNFNDIVTIIFKTLEKSNKKEVMQIMEKEYKRLRALYVFTGGNPRLAIFLAELLNKKVQNELDDVMAKLINELTPYFLYIYHDLPQELQDVIEVLAENEPAQNVKEIAAHLEDHPKNKIRGYVKLLKAGGYIKGAKRLSRYYCLNEYLYRVWYQWRIKGNKKKFQRLLGLLLILYSRDEKLSIKNRPDLFPEKPQPENKISKEIKFFYELPSYRGTFDFHLPTSRAIEPTDSDKITVAVKESKSEHKKSTKGTLKKDTLLDEAFDYMNIGDYNKAIMKCDQAIGKNEQSEYAYLYKAICFTKQRKYSKANDIFQTLTKQNPRMDISYLHWGDLYMEQSELYHQQAIDKYKQAIEINPKSEPGYIRWGNCLLEQKKYDEAIKKYQQVLIFNPKSVQAHATLDILYRKKGEYKKAYKAKEKALKHEPRSADEYVMQADLLFKDSEYLRAGKKYKKATEKDPKCVHGYLGYAESLWKTREKEKAIKIIKETTEQNDGSAECFRIFGKYLWEKNQHKEAEKKFEKMIVLDPFFDLGYRTYGECLWKSGNHGKALEMFKRMVDSNQSEECYHIYGNFLWKNERYYDAIEQFERIMTLNPKSEKPFQTVLSNLKAPKEAIAFFEKFKPEKELFNSQKDYLERVEFYKHALQSVESALYNKIEYYDTYLSYGNLLKNIGDKEQAFFAYLRYIRFLINTGSFDIQNTEKNITALLKSLDPPEVYIKRFHDKGRSALPRSLTCTILILFEQYNIVEVHIQEIIANHLNKGDKDNKNFKLLILTIKISILLNLFKGKANELSRSLYLYSIYITALKDKIDKEKKVMDFIADLYSVQNNKKAEGETIEIIFRMLEKIELSFGDILKEIWTCLSKPESVNAKRYMEERPIAEIVNKLKEMAVTSREH